MTASRLGLLAVVLLLSASAQVFAAPIGYTGSLTGSDIHGTGVWVDQLLLPADELPSWTAPSITWTITLNPDLSWHYDYTLSIYKKDISHLTLEVSPTFSGSNVRNASWPGGSIEVQDYGPDDGNSNPGMPGTFHGLKFDNASGTNLHVYFDSDRAPVWGDFYAKGGKSGSVFNAVWNAGFGNPDTDPSVPPGGGSLDGHLLVPDSRSYPPVPEPSSLAALGIGLMCLLARRRRRG